MKKTIKILGIFAMAALIGFSMIACDDGSGDPPTSDPNTATYTGTADGSTYSLKITKAVTPPGGTNPFVGTWNGTDINGLELTITFTATGWTQYWIIQPSTPTSGTYTYNGSTATLAYQGNAFATAAISAGVLTVTSQRTDIYTPWTLAKSPSLSVSYANSARYTAQVGDSYVLTVKTGNTTQTSSGTVTTIGGTLTLTPTGQTVTFSITVNTTGGITHIEGTITFSNGQTITLDTTVTPGTGSGGGTPPPPTGSVWPPDNILTLYGASGLTAPAGASVASYGVLDGNLAITFSYTSATAAALHNWFTSHGWEGGSGEFMPDFYQWEKGEETAIYYSGLLCFYPSQSLPVWPPNNVLAEYGLSGMTAPAGASDIGWSVTAASGDLILGILFTGSQANDAPITSAFTSNGWSLLTSSNINGSLMWMYQKSGFESGVYEREPDNGDCVIMVIK